MFNLRPRKSTVTRRIEASLSATFTESEIASMAGLGTLVDVAAGDELMTEATKGTHVFFICEGNAAVSRDETVIAMVSPGDMVGERALVTGYLRNATVTALEPVKALSFDRQQFAWLRLESNKVKSLTNELVSTRS